MNYLPNGQITFINFSDMYYDLFMELGLGIDANSYLYDQDTDMPILFKEKYIKANITGAPLYQGRNDIIFDPPKNYSLMDKLFGFYLDKCKNSDDGDILRGYIAHYIEDDPTKTKQRVVVKTVPVEQGGRGLIESEFYFNVYLAFIDCIFRIAGYNPNLQNFDIPPEKK